MGPTDGGEGQVSRSPEPGVSQGQRSLGGWGGGQPLQGHECNRNEVMVSGDGAEELGALGGGSRTWEGLISTLGRAAGRFSVGLQDSGQGLLGAVHFQRSVAPGPLQRVGRKLRQESLSREGDLSPEGQGERQTQTPAALVAAGPGAPAHWAPRGGVHAFIQLWSAS